MEFQKLCSLDVLGLIDNAYKSNIEFHTDFKEQLHFREEEVSKIKLLSKANRTDLPTNKEIVIVGLKATTRKLHKINKIQKYDIIMQEQVQEGIIEEYIHLFPIYLTLVIKIYI